MIPRGLVDNSSLHSLRGPVCSTPSLASIQLPRVLFLESSTRENALSPVKSESKTRSQKPPSQGSEKPTTPRQPTASASIDRGLLFQNLLWTSHGLSVHVLRLFWRNLRGAVELQLAPSWQRRTPEACKISIALGAWPLMFNDFLREAYCSTRSFSVASLSRAAGRSWRHVKSF